jgi:hypothetical protein
MRVKLFNYLHDLFHRGSLKVDKCKQDQSTMSALAEVKQLVETALTSVEAEIDNEVVQVVKSKLVDLQSFLSTVVDDAGEQLETPTPPADPNAALDTPAAPEDPVDPATPSEPVAPADPTDAPEAPTPPTDVVTPPADGSEPVTDSEGNEVTDPNAPR